MVSFLAAELLKVRTRWMPYVLFLVMVAGAAILVWLAGYASWVDEQNSEFRQDALRTFAFPWSIAALLDSGQFWGSAILVSILTASVVATEYSWGTVRQAIIRGQSRSQYVAAKVVAIAAVATISLLLALGVGLGFSAIATTIADRPITLDVPDGPSPLEIVLMVMRAAYGILPYGLLAFCLAVVGRSTALGLAGTMAYMFAEAIVLAILREVGGTLSDVRDFSIGHHVNALIAGNRIGNGDYGSFAPREPPLASELPDPNISALVITFYCLVLLAIAFLVFQRRDIRP